MSRNREENEILGTLPRPGEDPRFDGTTNTGDTGGVMVVDNGAFAEIEDGDIHSPVEVDQDPYLAHVTDEDGFPGYYPFVDESESFEVQEGLIKPENEDEEDLRDELKEHIDMNEEATVDVTGRPMSDLERMATVAHRKAQAIAEVAPYRRINPETANRALLGGRGIIRPGQEPVQVVNWVGEDVESLPVTITLNPTTRVATGAPNCFRGYVQLQWGTRDGISTALVDVGYGTQITVVASTVYVALGLDSSATDPLELSASLGYYTCLRNEPPTFTTYITLGAGGNVLTDRPAFASSVNFYASIPVGGASFGITLYFIGQADTVAYSQSYTSGAGQSVIVSIPIKLANDIVAVTVENSAPALAVPIECRLIWNLFL